MPTPAEELAELKAELANLKQRELHEGDPATKNQLNQRIIESTRTLNLLLQGTFLFPDFFFLSSSICHQLIRPPFLLQTPAPQSHLHIGLPFGTPIPCLQLEQVMIPLGSFSPTL